MLKKEYIALIVAGLIITIICVVTYIFWPSNETITLEPGCVMYGMCGRGRTCANTTAPSPLDPESLQALSRFCPDLVAKHGSSGGALCCSADQVQSLVGKLDWEILDLCPSCGYNVRELFCNLVCSPYQSTYAKVVVSAPGSEAGQQIVKKIDFKVNDEYISRSFESCEKVKNQDNSSFIISHMCGTYGSESCTPHLLFRKLAGGKSTDFVPFVEVDFYWVDPNANNKTIVAQSFSTEAVSCAKAPPGMTKACKSYDCAEAGFYFFTASE